MLIVLMLLDLSSGLAARDGLQLALGYRGGPTRGGAQQVTVSAELTNTGKKPLRIVWQPSGEQPLTLIVDGKSVPLPPGAAKAASVGWRELKPGEKATETSMQILPVGAHTLGWRYVVDKGPYGQPLANCWTGTLVTPPITAPIPNY